MKFEALRTMMAKRPFFRPEDLHMGNAPPPYELVQLSLWASEGRLLRLKKGFYALRDSDSQRSLSALELADPLYRPSYISLEWALSRYGIIPEAVGTITSVTQLKTATFQNHFGKFDYKHIAPDYFFGYVQETKPVPYFLATPEKALLDFIHLSIPRSIKITEDLLTQSYRFQNLEQLKKNRLVEALRRFKTPRVQQGGGILLNLMGRKHG